MADAAFRAAFAAVLVGAVALAEVTLPRAVPMPHGSPWAPEFSAQAAALLAQMSTQEKLAMVHGYGNGEWWLGITLSTRHATVEFFRRSRSEPRVPSGHACPRRAAYGDTWVIDSSI
jgi:hypothetical protein